MRHRKIGTRLGRTTSHKKAMLRNMAVSLLEHEQIKTTLPKAKEVRRFVEPLITMSKEDNLARRRRAFNALRSKDIVHRLFTEIGPRYSSRPGGYTRIMKCGYRAGDNAPMAIMQFV